MATVRDSDTSLWLHNKLGDNEDLWSGISSISTQLKRDVLENIHHCFVALTPTVKLKLLMAILHMPRRSVDELKDELSAILHLALTDTDQWVSTIADILRSYPTTGQLNLDLEENHPFIAETLKDLRKTLSETDTNALLPLECQYLNKNALNQLVGMQVPPVKHFQLKRKPKSAALRAELLQKSAEAQQQSKKLTGSSSIPIKIRGISRKSLDESPMRGFSANKPASFRQGKSPVSRLPMNRTGSRLATNREGGTKLLDIMEQPIGGNSREAKKRKRQQEMEAQEQAKKEKEKEKEAAEATPDYAAALMSPAVAKKPHIAETPTTEAPTPSYAPRVDYTEPATPGPSILSSISQNPPSATTLAARENLQNTLHQTLQQQREFRKPSTPATPSTPPVDFTPSTSYNPTSAAAAPPRITPLPHLKYPLHNRQASRCRLWDCLSDPPAVPSQPAVVAAAASAPKKGLSLTRDQMIAAQEMFRQSNKVTRPEKALILGFMAGARDNPCPQQGDIVTIRLSENTEMVPKDDRANLPHAMLADTFFEMNYATGEWRRYKKYKPIQAL
ncbi:putative negative elongation factor A [Apostichopus japonicus]|uniref:Putative negative elongation factor A n=1 Tax=Stichopus japonicus TaxID=307972 RepID=A0A2G8KMM4_STIJA|nr:putative negative elongation factor A [Apostichopus japonicus]